MLLSFFGINVDQPEIVNYLGVQRKIIDEGVTIEELGRFVHDNYPQYQFWYRFNSSITQLSQLINQYRFPVAVEWQGIFDYPDEDILDDEDDDPGHISVVTAIDTNQNCIYIADPDTHYAGTDRKFSILQFERRWWDINRIIDPITHKTREIDDYHGLFFITPANISFPDDFNLLKP